MGGRGQARSRAHMDQGEDSSRAPLYGAAAQGHAKVVGGADPRAGDVNGAVLVRD